MLTACGSSNTATTITAENLGDGNGVVAYIQANMSKDKVGANQVAVTLSGNEESDKKTAVKAAKNGEILGYTLDEVEQGKIAAQYQDHRNAGKTYVYAVPKSGDADSDLGDAILTRMENLKTASTDADPRYVFAKISVFDAEVSYDASMNIMGNVTIDGTTIFDGTVEYWIVVVTVGENPSTTTGQF